MGVISPYVSSIILLAHTILHEIIVQFENSIYSVYVYMYEKYHVVGKRKPRISSLYETSSFTIQNK